MASTPSSAGRPILLSTVGRAFNSWATWCNVGHITGHGPKAAKHPEFHWVNTLSNLKTFGTFMPLSSTVTATSPSSPGDSIGVQSKAVPPAAVAFILNLYAK